MRLIGVALALMLTSASAPQGRFGRVLEGPIASAIESARSATVSVHQAGQRVGYGVIVDAGGWIVTKSSTIEAASPKEEIYVKLEGRRRLARIVARFDDDDIAVLRFVAGKSFPTTTWRDTSREELRPGQIALSVGVREAIGFGVVGVSVRKIPRETGFLGVFLEDVNGGRGARVKEVQEGSAARRAGIVDGDVVVQVGESKIDDTDDLTRAVRAAGAGAKLELVVERRLVKRKLAAVLGSRAEDLQELRLSGSTLSDRRSGFERAFQHDGGLSADECGSPVVDVEGRVIGLNIARAGRVQTYAVSADRVLELVRPVIQASTTQ